MRRLLVTGSEGLIGTELTKSLEGRSFEVVPLDVRLPGSHPGAVDIASAARVADLAQGCHGIVHLAAVSRVAWGEQDPVGCWRTNVHGTRHVLQAALKSADKPWVLFGSSREVYGEPDQLPVDEDAPLRPVNTYGRSKLAGEQLVLEARSAGLATAIVRLANVYGAIHDHPDRVAPAFARGVAEGADLRVIGGGCTFDFTHVDDVIAGLLRIVDLLEDGQSDLPTVHFCTGHGTTLRELAAIASRLGHGVSVIEEGKRPFDVSGFIGDPRRAHELLGWRATIDIAQGMRRLTRDFEQAGRQAVAADLSR
jgi:nucleoside-diphosphate-sugar epimerase